MTADEPPTVLRIVRGEPTEEEIAALVVALSTTSPLPPAAAAPRSAWRDRGRPARRLPRPGPGAWRASVHPE